MVKQKAFKLAIEISGAGIRDNCDEFRTSVGVLEFAFLEIKCEITFSYTLVVNLELKQRLLMMATQAKVAKPLRLKSEMDAMITEAQVF